MAHDDTGVKRRGAEVVTRERMRLGKKNKNKTVAEPNYGIRKRTVQLNLQSRRKKRQATGEKVEIYFADTWLKNVREKNEKILKKFLFLSLFEIN